MSFLVRHAAAVERHAWPDDDRMRPLDGTGRRQALEIVSALSSRNVRRVVSSPYIRCIQTVEPLAAARGLEVELDDRLAEGAGTAAQALLEEDGVVACTHGDVIHDLTGRGLKTGEFVEV
jgi:phosphohistidine phosphatase SixA